LKGIRSYDLDPPVIPGLTGPGGETEPPAGYSYANDGGIVDIVATLRLLFNLLGLELNMETFQLQSIGEPITFEPCTYPAESGENLDPITLSDDCACEQSVYWANLEAYNCEELNILYFYHPDYLGSVEYVTDIAGEPYQPVRRSLGEGGFFLNTPWGDQAFKKSLVDFFSAGASLPRGQENQYVKNYTSFSSRFRFNGKEWEGRALKNKPVAYFSEGASLPRWQWDEEPTHGSSRAPLKEEWGEQTGNFYYGARYYDPKISVWLSVDPMASDTPYLTPYRFSFNNPLNVVDPNGMFETGYELLSDGRIVELKGAEGAEGGASYDVLYGTNQLTGKRGKMTQQFAKGILGAPFNDKNPKEGPFTSYYIDDKQLATGFFEFAAKSSKVEFSHLRYRGDDNAEGSIVSTSHDASSEWGGTTIAGRRAKNKGDGGNDYVYSLDHSHP